MADDKEKSPEERVFPDTDQQKSKRPTATLDLEATEVKPEEEALKASLDEKLEEARREEDEKSEGAPFNFSSIFSSAINTHIAAGFIGGVVVVALFWSMQQIGSEGRSAADAKLIKQLSARVDVMDARFKSDLKEEAANLNKDYQDKLSQLDKKIATIAASAKSKDGSHIAESAAVTNLLSEMESNFQKKLAEMRTKLEAQIAVRVSEASKEIKQSIPAGADVAGGGQEISKNLAQVQKDNTDVKQKIRSYDDNVMAMNQRMHDLASEVAVLRAQAMNSSKVNSAIDPVSQKVAELEKKLEKALANNISIQQGARSTALSLAFTGLKRAADRGERFEAELEAFKELTAASQDIQALAAYQGKGVQPLRNLEKQFPDVILKALKADRQPKDKTLLGKLAANATSFVRFRRTGNVPGEDAEAVLARMEFNIKRGNYEKALEESKVLKGPARTEASVWIEQFEARLKLDDTLQKIEMSLLSQLGSGQSGREIH